MHFKKDLDNLIEFIESQNNLRPVPTHRCTSNNVFEHAYKIKRVLKKQMRISAPAPGSYGNAELPLHKLSLCVLRGVCTNVRMQYCHTYEWVLSHSRMSHVAHMNESRLTHKHRSRHGWQNAALHVLTVTCINASRLLIQMSYVARTNKPRYVHVYRGYVAHMNESCHTREYRSRHGCQNAALYLPTLVQIALCLLRTPRSSLPKQQQQKVL